MSTLSIDSRHPCAADALMALRRGDLEMQGIFKRLSPETTIRVVDRAYGRHLEHVETVRRGEV